MVQPDLNEPGTRTARNLAMYEIYRAAIPVKLSARRA